MAVIHLFIWLYTQFLWLYPASYRAEFGAELAAVFRLALHAARRQGTLAVLRVGLRELRDVPIAAFQVHRRLRFRRLFFVSPGSNREILMALAPFLMLGILPPLFSLLAIPLGVFNVLAMGMLLLLAALLLVGIGRGLPRWSLPYLGVIFSLVSVYGLREVTPGGLTWQLVGQNQPLWWRQVVYQGERWLGLPLIMFVVVALSWLLPPLRSFCTRVQQDWTLLSFMLYGAGLFALVYTFDDYPDEEPYLLLAMALLAGGGWVYLRAKTSRQRIAALFAGLTLAMGLWPPPAK
jgi:hypothetical protein